MGDRGMAACTAREQAENLIEKLMGIETAQADFFAELGFAQVANAHMDVVRAIQDERHNLRTVLMGLGPS